MQPHGIRLLIPESSDLEKVVESELEAFDQFFSALQPGGDGMIEAERNVLRSYLLWKLREGGATALTPSAP